MNPKKLRDCLGLTVEAIAKRGGVSKITWYRWEESDEQPKKYAFVREVILDSLQKDIAKIRQEIGA